MSKKKLSAMRSFGDMPKFVIILEVIGLLLLLLVYLVINNYIELAALFMKKGVLLAMIMLAIGCMIPAIVHIVWRALPKLSFFGIDQQKNSSEHHQRKLKAKQCNHRKMD
ncbi:DUF1418 family protein [Candidatus Arsenophonus nilaparvatae]|nr:DUF1418 family protein [Candidatus Arsenophonus nilaparvatae]